MFWIKYRILFYNSYTLKYFWANLKTNTILHWRLLTLKIQQFESINLTLDYELCLAVILRLRISKGLLSKLLGGCFSCPDYASRIWIQQNLKVWLANSSLQFLNVIQQRISSKCHPYYINTFVTVSFCLFRCGKYAHASHSAYFWVPLFANRIDH